MRWGRRGDRLALDEKGLQHAVELRDSGQVREALEEFTALTESTTDLEEKASLLINQVRCYRLLGRLTEARQRLSAARRIAPKTHLLLYLEYENAVLRWHEGKRSESLDILNSLQSNYGKILRSPEHKDLYEQVQSGRGMLLAELARYREAKPLLEESLSFDARIIEKEGVLRDLGLCYLELGDRDRAKEAFTESLRENAHGVYATMAHYYLGTIYFEGAAFAKAALEFEASLSGAEEAQIPKEHLYQYLARTSRHLGMGKEAERYEKLSKSPSGAEL